MDLHLSSAEPSSELWLLEPYELPLFELDWSDSVLEPLTGSGRPGLITDGSDLLAELSELANDAS